MSGSFGKSVSRIFSFMKLKESTITRFLYPRIIKKGTGTGTKKK